MLKDLDQRQARRGASQQQQTVGEVKKSTKKILILTSLVSIAITLTALFTWQLYQEVKLLKAQKSAAQQAQLLSSTAKEKRQQNQSVATNNDVFNDSQNTAAYKANKANVVKTENNITESTSNKDSTTNPSSISANSSALAAASTNPKADNNLTQKNSAKFNYF
jgi:sensor c-di-GMP phosphodiesterase-like protein